MLISGIRIETFGIDEEPEEEFQLNKDDLFGNFCVYAIYIQRIKHEPSGRLHKIINEDLRYGGEGIYKTRILQHIRKVIWRMRCTSRCDYEIRLHKELKETLMAHKQVKVVSIRVATKWKAALLESALLELLKSAKLINKNKGHSKTFKEMNYIFRQRLGIYTLNTMQYYLKNKINVTCFNY